MCKNEYHTGERLFALSQCERKNKEQILPKCEKDKDEKWKKKDAIKSNLSNERLS